VFSLNLFSNTSLCLANTTFACSFGSSFAGCVSGIQCDSNGDLWIFSPSTISSAFTLSILNAFPSLTRMYAHTCTHTHTHAHACAFGFWCFCDAMIVFFISAHGLFVQLAWFDGTYWINHCTQPSKTELAVSLAHSQIRLFCY
jgi:hypothetical protein